MVSTDHSVGRPPIDRERVRTALLATLEAEPLVVAAYLFGSVAMGTAGPLSDIDIGLLASDHDHTAAICERTQDGLSRLLGSSAIDVIALADTPIPLRYRVVRDGVRMLSRDAVLVERFVVDTVMQYLDFAPLRARGFEQVRTAILAGV